MEIAPIEIATVAGPRHNRARPKSAAAKAGPAAGGIRPVGPVAPTKGGAGTEIERPLEGRKESVEPLRAWKVHEYGEPLDCLKLQEGEAEPRRQGGDVLVDIAAVGLNFADLLSIQGRYQIWAPLPFTPGIEASGTVAVADDAGRLAAGQKVIVAMPWGALAERVCVPAELCFAVPEGMSHRQAAALLLTYQTSHFALERRARLLAGEFLLVHNGAGGVGSAAIQIGKALGATVAATAGGPEKLEVCRRAGADHLIDYREGDLASAVLEWTDGRGADVIYDSIGGDVFDASTRCIAFEGRLLVIGFAGGRIPTIAANRIMLKNIAVVGLNWGAYRDHHPDEIRRVHDEICTMHRNGQISPVLFDTYAFEELPRALSDLQNRRSYGKLIIETGQEFPG